MPERGYGGFQKKRLNPYKGLIIDVPIWTAAHNYHRDQQRLHAASAHRPGVVTGLEVSAWEPADNSVVVHPGIAIDADGNTIVVPEPQRFYLNLGEKGTAHIVIRYAEIPQDMAEIPGEARAHPLYILEGFRLEERRDISANGYLELARVDLDAGSEAVQDAADPTSPQSGEIDWRYRTVSGPRTKGEVTIGVLTYPSGKPVKGWDSHRQGITNLVESIKRDTAYSVRVLESVDLTAEAREYDLLMMCGHAEFVLSEAEEAALLRFFKTGGVLFAEACSARDSAKGFRSSIAGLCDKLGCNLRTIDAGHPVFRSYHIFAELPPGTAGALLMHNNGIIYSDADYGCAWAGGKPDAPLPRGTIRDALEFGTNIAMYAEASTRRHSLKLGMSL